MKSRALRVAKQLLARALDEIARVLAPGGRVALLSSCSRGPVPTAITSPFVKGVTGVRMFARDELTRAVRARGLTDVQQRVSGLAQFVAARKPARMSGSSLKLESDPRSAVIR